jgi:uncharacterized protein (DUF433 family)
MASGPLTLDSEIVSDPGILLGEPTIVGTATSVRAIAELWNQGMPPDEIPVHLPHLQLRQVFAALHYYLGHRAEIEAFITNHHISSALSGKHFDAATGQIQ